ncbi:MAG: efflux RND transporter periplasmic adaptor subunit [Alphaproteobacteria bacterium]|nr:efflux RND transporter periplasmic adaptor subunit [Alphaproteobacteria bacterium]
MKNIQLFPSLALTALLLAMPAWAAPPAKAPPPVQVIVEAVSQQQFTDNIEALGTLKANESITLTATVTDTITAVNFSDGQRVNKGDALVEMTSAEEAANLAQERSTLTEARKQLERIQTLAAQGNASKALLDQRQRDVETAQARIAAIQSRLKDYLITAPFDGIVGLRNVSVGALVQPGTRITTLDDDSVMKLDFSVPSLFLPVLQTGLEVEATNKAFGDKKFTGTVSGIDSQIDPVTRAIQVRALLPNDEKLLKPGLLMNVVIKASPRTTVAIPEKAIVAEGAQHFVFTAENGKAVKKQVTVGGRTPGIAEITEGLSVGEQLITSGLMNIRDGAAITPNSAKKAD